MDMLILSCKPVIKQRKKMWNYLSLIVLCGDEVIQFYKDNCYPQGSYVEIRKGNKHWYYNKYWNYQ